MKKILAIFLLSLLIFTSACNKEKKTNNQQTDDTKIILPNLNGKSRFEIESIMKDYDVEYKFKFANTIIKHDGELNKFVSFNDGAYKVGDSFPKSETLLIYTTVLPLNPTLCYKLEMPFDYEGKSDDAIELAFEDGVAAYISDRYGVERECIKVMADGFSLEKLQAERIYVTLSGKAALLDYKRIEKCLTHQTFLKR